MKSWDNRPQEVANLLNPAFCGRVIYQAVDGYRRESSRGMPYSLAFVVLPLVLHPATRGTIDGRTRHFQVWLNTNQQIKIGFAGRGKSLIPYAREAVAFLCQTYAVEIQRENGSLSVGQRLQANFRGQFEPGDDTRSCLTKAVVLGKWFARVNSPATIYASLGVMP